MPRPRATISIPSLGAVDPAAGQVGRQIAGALRVAISGNELKPGELLPSTRALSASLGVARGTVVEAFEQLQAEGYLQSEVGAGTRVAATLADTPPPARPRLNRKAETAPVRMPARAKRLAEVAAAFTPMPEVPFAIPVPGGAVAPDDNWRRLGNRVRASRTAAPASYGDPRGLTDLREAIADYVRKSRGVHCAAEEVVITAGTQQGLYLAGRVLLARGDHVWAEDPAYPGMTAVLDDLEVVTTRVPVDAQGIDVDAGIAVCPQAAAAFVTPSHQYPLGMPMSMARRKALVGWAQRRNAWIVEDDYDSELRYAGHPFPSLQGLDPSRVIYLGTLSKVLFPSLRLGYVVAPAPLVDAFAGARALLDRHSPTADQHVLAAYMREGLFEAHIRRIRGVYAARRATLITALERHMHDDVTLQPSDQGMHLLLWLPKGTDDVQLAKAALVEGIVVRPISPMYKRAARAGLMLGFGGFAPEALQIAAIRLCGIIKQHGAPRYRHSATRRTSAPGHETRD
ncbi:PLP-dependent aminotransferase family protein [Bradyrhizobium jicamae]|uniref:PLP-dependent aminotransferase family protein n=1 Tax=Bradyrhizobium jicamae TaxID=280332 RepID=A0ABS5FMK6_9BRAD|nr:PLP-dependent aminotransferase family protein [Bradyrhizobium jicamae]MBR0797889.1 PLP-dependent aminotransferase family protein [Bradyrhizobium jicamae]MBR0935916.1 PLP-dependent aminotransferase family protein [Bradyrhizobium jicamae]